MKIKNKFPIIIILILIILPLVFFGGLNYQLINGFLFFPKLTEFTSFGERFGSVFCVDRKINWQENDNIKMSYLIKLKNNYKFFIQDESTSYIHKDLRVETINFIENREYKPNNIKSISCYNVSISLEKIPILSYQDFNSNEKDGGFHERAFSEQKDFYEKIDYVYFLFKDNKGNQILSFTSKK